MFTKKSIAITLSLILVLLFAMAASADYRPTKIDDAELALSKIGAEIVKVKEVYDIYGKPDRKVEEEYTPYLQTTRTAENLIWTGKMRILVTKSSNGERIIQRVTSYTPGLVTPAGIHVGSTLKDLKKAYGAHLGNEGLYEGNRVFYIFGNDKKMCFTVKGQAGTNSEILIIEMGDKYNL